MGHRFFGSAEGHIHDIIGVSDDPLPPE